MGVCVEGVVLAGAVGVVVGSCVDTVELERKVTEIGEGRIVWG